MSGETWALLLVAACIGLWLGYLLAQTQQQAAARFEHPVVVDWLIPYMDTEAVDVAPPVELTAHSVTGLQRAAPDDLRAELELDPQNLGYMALGQDYQALAERINRAPTRSIPNPTPRPNVPVPLDLAKFTAQLTPTETLAIYGLSPLKAELERVLRRGDRAALAALLASIGSMFAPATQRRLQDLLLQVEPDPAWTARIAERTPSRAEQLGWQPVRATDIQEVW